MAPGIPKDCSTPYMVQISCNNCSTSCTCCHSTVRTERVEISDLADVIREVKYKIKQSKRNKHSAVTLKRELAQLETAMRLVRKHGAQSIRK